MRRTLSLFEGTVRGWSSSTNTCWISLIGAINALQDAVILVNSIVDMVAPTLENITAAFEDYREQRYPQTKRQMDKARVLATIQYGQARPPQHFALVNYLGIKDYDGYHNERLTNRFSVFL